MSLCISKIHRKKKLSEPIRTELDKGFVINPATVDDNVNASS
jgi:hypothetical protein